MATIRLDSQKTLVNADVSGGTAKLVEDKGTVFHGAADTLQLPLSCEVGYSFTLTASAAAIVTAAAQSGETLEGETTTAAAVGSSIRFVKRTSTVWNGAFVTGGAVVA